MTDITLTKVNIGDMAFWRRQNIRPGSRLCLNNLPEDTAVHLNDTSITIGKSGTGAGTGAVHCYCDADLDGGSFGNLRVAAAGRCAVSMQQAIGTAGPGAMAAPDDRNSPVVRPDLPRIHGATRIACFARGTMIETATGPQRIETLAAGDMVRTLDHGLQPIQAVGQRSVPGIGAFAPVVFETGCIGNTRRLLLSPYHRVILGGGKAELLFGVSEVLVQALFMVNGTSIRQSPIGVVSYHHLLMEGHEILFSDGALTESFNPCLPTDADDTDAIALRAELQALMPELSGHLTRTGPRFQTSARRILQRFEVSSLLN